MQNDSMGVSTIWKQRTSPATEKHGRRVWNQMQSVEKREEGEVLYSLYLRGLIALDCWREELGVARIMVVMMFAAVIAAMDCLHA